MESREQIEAALLQVCESKSFSRSPSLTRLLTYLVRETLEGRDTNLKGYAIGLAIFGRQKDFDPEADSIVRVNIQRLRQALKLYYLESGKNDPLRIEVPKGGYVPRFAEQAKHSPGETNRVETRIALTVMPIDNLSGDPAQDFFALGFMEELIGTLGAYKELEIISTLSVGNRTDSRTPDISRQARFLLHGSSRLSADHIRIIIVLIDTETGRQVWTKRYKRDRTIDDLFAIQEEIASDVVQRIADRYAGVINRTLIGEMSQGSRKNLSTYEAVLRLHTYNTNTSVDTYHLALGALEAAVEAHPEHAMACAALAELYSDGYAIWQADADKERVLARALTYADRAINLDPTNEYGYIARSFVLIVSHDMQNLRRTIEELLSLEPPPASIILGAWCLTLAGEWDRGLAMLSTYPTVVSTGPGWLQHIYFLDHYRQGRYEEALVAANAFCTPGLFWDPVDRAAALGMLGRVDEGRRAVAEILNLQPDFALRPRRWLECYVLQDDLLDQVIEGLEKAGMKLGA